MSSHCNRYPSCGCSSSIGTKCHLVESDTKQAQEELPYFEPEDPKISKDPEFSGPTGPEEPEIRRNAKGYPLKTDGTVDWDLTAKEKGLFAKEPKKPHHKYPRGYTPPKKRRRK